MLILTALNTSKLSNFKNQNFEMTTHHTALKYVILKTTTDLLCQNRLENGCRTEHTFRAAVSIPNSPSGLPTFASTHVAMVMATAKS
jgi:hypothetical protein